MSQTLPPRPKPLMSLWLAVAFLVILIVPPGIYLAIKIWFYRLNSRFRTGSAELRERLSKNAVLSPESQKRGAVFVGFFHPYCNAGGGGERVLWTAIKAIQLDFPQIVSIIYSGDTQVSQEEILQNVKRRFNIDLDPKTIHIVHLYQRKWVSAARYPVFTMVGQSLGSLILAYEAISYFVPDIFIDTMGYAFTLPFVSSVLEIPTAAYVHYPTISTDMLQALQGKSSIKRRYYKLFALAYGYACNQINVLMTNSSWTQAHMRQLTGPTRSFGEIQTIFPPCDTKTLNTLPLSPREKLIIYLAQFRPEKQHHIVLRSFSILLTKNPELRNEDVKLIFIGSVRDERDQERVAALRKGSEFLGVQDQVQFICDARWDEVVTWLARGWIGTNAMWNEHFGIGVVEYMAAGLIPVVHDSGGPKMDIVTEIDGQPTGFHASKPPEFADAFAKALSLGEDECFAMRERARKSSERFSEEAFMKAWTEQMHKLLALETKYRGERIYRTGGS